MVAIVPEQVRTNQLIDFLKRNGLNEISVGKVRHTFELPEYPDYLLQVASDRISIYDFVLPALVRDKGPILTAMTVFWLSELLVGVQHHLVAYGSGIDDYLPASLQKNPELQVRALVVRRLEMLPVECIVRGYLTGSGWSAYRDDNGRVCGIQLPEGLHDGSRLPEPIFTPTTKAEVGHDEHLLTADVESAYPGIGQLSKQIYDAAHTYALGRGVVLPDTKFEVGRLKGCSSGYVLGDEVLTPDSSRFWDLEEWATAANNRKSPAPYDKQYVRNWGSQYKLGSLDPAGPEDLRFVENQVVPQGILDTTTDIYHKIFTRIARATLEEFWYNTMGIRW